MLLRDGCLTLNRSKNDRHRYNAEDGHGGVDDDERRERLGGKKFISTKTSTVHWPLPNLIEVP